MLLLAAATPPRYYLHPGGGRSKAQVTSSRCHPHRLLLLLPLHLLLPLLLFLLTISLRSSVNAPANGVEGGLGVAHDISLQGVVVLVVVVVEVEVEVVVEVVVEAVLILHKATSNGSGVLPAPARATCISVSNCTRAVRHSSFPSCGGCVSLRGRRGNNLPEVNLCWTGGCIC